MKTHFDNETPAVYSFLGAHNTTNSNQLELFFRFYPSVYQFCLSYLQNAINEAAFPPIPFLEAFLPLYQNSYPHLHNPLLKSVNTQETNPINKVCLYFLPPKF